MKRVGRQPSDRTPRALDVHAARVAAADLLSRRAWTRAELDARLRRRGAPAEVAAHVVADLVGQGHVDDAAFARQWVQARSARGYGPVRLRAELRARGVDTTLIEAAIAGTTDDGPLERARALGRRRLAALAGAAPGRLPSRLGDYLLRRGYPGSIVARVVRELTGRGQPD